MSACWDNCSDHGKYGNPIDDPGGIKRALLTMVNFNSTINTDNTQAKLHQSKIGNDCLHSHPCLGQGVKNDYLTQKACLSAPKAQCRPRDILPLVQISKFVLLFTHRAPLLF